MDTNPFPNLNIQSPFFLNDIKGRSICPVCGKSRKFYCYTCYKPLGGENYEHRVPKLKLPVKIDIIKHPQEVDGKSTATHAAILAPEDVTVYTYPTIPLYSDKVLLVYPGVSAITFDEYVTKHCPLVPKSESYQKGFGKEDGYEQTFTRQEKSSASSVIESSFTVMPLEKSCSKDFNKLKRSIDLVSHKSCVEEPDSAKKCKEVNEICEDTTLTIEKHCNEAEVVKYMCTFDKVVFIDSTWHSVNKIASDERLKGLQRIELKSETTKFWRHQQDKPDTYLATIEAIYYFLCDYHQYFVSSVYNGEYDNMLFYFVFMYDKIRHMYEGGKYIKAYNQKQI